MEHLYAEKRQAEKLVFIRYEEYRQTILGFGYSGAVERLHKAIARYESIKQSLKEIEDGNLKLN
jgi:hypothetical protein